jgi:uncharacterized protein YkwD
MKNQMRYSKNIALGLILMILYLSVPAKDCLFVTVSGHSFSADFEDEERKIYKLVNKERQERRVKELKWNEDLAKLARAYSEKMAKESFFSHVDKDRKSPTDRVREAKITGWQEVGENLFYYPKVAKDIFIIAVDNWMKSPGHRRNILNRNFTATGVGIAKSKRGEIYVTQIFIQN